MADHAAPTLVLGSTSRYRRAVLEKLGIDFVTDKPEIDETRFDGESAIDLVKRLSLEKARAVATRHPDALVIGSDQVACLDDEILTKPGNFDNAVEQLSSMAGRPVTFHSGLCLLNTTSGEHQLDVVDFTVTLRKLGREQIENYLRRDEPYDSAGSFKSEGLGIALFESMEGNDPNSLIGLPLIRLIAMLEQEGMDVLSV